MSEESLAARVVAVLKNRGDTLAFCESLTAGLASGEVANVPGASRILRGGLVTYATELKHTLAGVSQITLDSVGPVARETAIEMAQGVREKTGSTWGVSLTGVAGPDPQGDHQPGEVWTAVAGPGASEGTPAVWCQQHQLSGGRQKIRSGAVQCALEDLLKAISGAEN